MAERIRSAGAIELVIREHYDLGEVSEPKSIEGAHQRRHRKLYVDTDRGRFLVKTYRRDQHVLDALRFQHRLADHLMEHGLPVVRILPSKSGKRIVEVEDWALELQEFVAGEAMPVNATTLRTAAEALGKFHHVCRGIPCPPRDARKWRFSDVPRDLFGKLYERAHRQGNPAEVDDACNRIALFIRETSERLTHDRLHELETGLIHGDWHSGNLLFAGNRLRAILDLEFAGDGCYLEDIAYAISNLCVRTSTGHDILDRRTDLLLETYSKYRRLAPSEDQALFYAVGVKHIATVAYQSLQMDGTVAGKSPADWMQILDAQTQWLTRRAHEQYGLV